MRSRPTLRAHQKVALVAVTFLVGGCTVLALTYPQVASVQAKLSSLQQRLLAEQHHLIDVATDVAQARSPFIAATMASDISTRTAQLQRSLDASNAALTDWALYKRHALDLPGERAHQAGFESAAATTKTDGRTAGLAVLDAPAAAAVPPNAAITSVLTAIDAEAAEIRAIEQDYGDAITSSLASARKELDESRRDGLIAFGAALALGLVVTWLSARAARRQERQLYSQELERARIARRNDFDARLGRGLEMAGTEEDVYEVVERALLEVLHAGSGELLIADSSWAHYRQVLHTGTRPGAACGVASPADCPAARRGQALLFESTVSLDACPHLRASAPGPCSAVCVPLAIGGHSVGVIHVDEALGDVPDGDTVTDLELIARKSGERIGMIRAFADSEAKAQTDPLTGLLNRRSVENRVRELVGTGQNYVVAYGDLDRFKDLNDTHGHETGDRALRAFSRVLRESVRPADIPGRYGGEEFVVVLPECSVDDAISAIERLRENLALSLTSGAAPMFTVSFGIAASDPTSSFDEVVARADAALLTAKANGRNRVVAASDAGSDQGGPAPTAVGTNVG